jgi:oligoendopeptidase F
MATSIAADQSTGSTTPSTRYPLTWDLASLLPDPSGDEFRNVMKQYREELTWLAEQSDRLPPVTAAADDVARWVALLREYESLDARGNDLRSFVGCHAAADAQNKLFQQLEAELAALSPLAEQVATNVEFALKEAGDAAFGRGKSTSTRRSGPSARTTSTRPTRRGRPSPIRVPTRSTTSPARG